MKPKPKFAIGDKLIHKFFQAIITHANYHDAKEKLLLYPETDWYYSLKITRERWHSPRKVLNRNSACFT